MDSCNRAAIDEKEAFQWVPFCDCLRRPCGPAPSLAATERSPPPHSNTQTHILTYTASRKQILIKPIHLFNHCKNFPTNLYVPPARSAELRSEARRPQEHLEPAQRHSTRNLFGI